MRREELCEIIEELCYNFGIMMDTDDYVYELIGPAKKCKVELYAPVDDPAEDPLANPPAVESSWFKSYKSLAEELIKLNTMVVACCEDPTPDYEDIDWYEVIEGYEGMRNEDPSIDLRAYFEFLFGENWARAALAYSEWEENLDIEEEPLEDAAALGLEVPEPDDDWDQLEQAVEELEDVEFNDPRLDLCFNKMCYWFERYNDWKGGGYQEELRYGNYIFWANEYEKRFGELQEVK